MRETESTITTDLITTVSIEKSSLYGLEYRLKSNESLARKILNDSIEKGISKEFASKKIKDTLRYTVINT